MAETLPPHPLGQERDSPHPNSTRAIEFMGLGGIKICQLEV